MKQDDAISARLSRVEPETPWNRPMYLSLASVVGSWIYLHTVHQQEGSDYKTTASFQPFQSIACRSCSFNTPALSFCFFSFPALAC